MFCYNGVIVTEQPLSLHKCSQLPLHRGAKKVRDCIDQPLSLPAAASSPYTGEPKRWGKNAGSQNGRDLGRSIIYCFFNKTIDIFTYAVKIILNFIIRYSYYSQSVLFEKSGAFIVIFYGIVFKML